MLHGSVTIVAMHIWRVVSPRYHEGGRLLLKQPGMYGRGDIRAMRVKSGRIQAWQVGRRDGC